jgi:hypothetical protein
MLMARFISFSKLRIGLAFQFSSYEQQKLSQGLKRIAGYIAGADIFFAPVVKVFGESGNLWMVGRVVVTVDQTLDRSLFPRVGIMICRIADPNINVSLIAYL